MNLLGPDNLASGYDLVLQVAVWKNNAYQPKGNNIFILFFKHHVYESAVYCITFQNLGMDRALPASFPQLSIDLWVVLTLHHSIQQASPPALQK